MSWKCVQCTCSNPANVQHCKKCGTKSPAKSPRPTIQQFGVSDREIRIGHPTIFHWEVTGAETLELVPHVGSVIDKSFIEVFLKKGGEYTLRATNKNGRAYAKLLLSLPGPEINRFEVSTQMTELHDPATLKWEVTNASKVFINPGIGEVESSGECEVSPKAKTTYTLKAINASGKKEASLSIDILPPKIEYFKASTELITEDKPVELFWRVLNAHKVWLNHGIGEVPAEGTVKIRIDKPFDTYKLYAEGPSGKSSMDLSLTLFPVPLNQQADNNNLELSPETIEGIYEEVPDWFVEAESEPYWIKDTNILLERPSVRKELRQVYHKILRKLDMSLDGR